MHRYLAIVLAASISSTAWGEEIPLKEIWALDMPGTRDIRELDPRTTEEPTAITKINRVFFTKLDEGTEPGKCFLVKGKGREALENAEKVLVCNEPRLKSAPQGAALSLVFYAHPAPGYVHLDSVEYSKGLIAINYQVVIHPETNATSHFALIPLPTDLPPGKLAIKAVQVPAKDNKVPMPDPKRTERAVCESCSFAIE
jgi:hypothetical protein